AAEKYGLPVGIHAGSAYRHPVTPLGWPTYYTEDYAAQATAFQAALSSLVCEGVFTKFPDLKVVLLESGFTWLPAHLWRLTKFWRGCAWKCRGWTARPPISCGAMSVSRPRPAMRRPRRKYSSACSTTWDRTRCCCSPPIIPTGSSTATQCCPRGCRVTSSARS